MILLVEIFSDCGLQQVELWTISILKPLLICCFEVDVVLFASCVMPKTQTAHSQGGKGWWQEARRNFSTPSEQSSR